MRRRMGSETPGARSASRIPVRENPVKPLLFFFVLVTRTLIELSNAQTHKPSLFHQVRALLGSHSPLGDLKARFQGVECANPRQRRDSRVRNAVSRIPVFIHQSKSTPKGVLFVLFYQ